MRPVADLLSKLQPLMPERVKRWRQNLEVADKKTRALLERQIANVARDELGDPGGLYLSLPPRRRARGEVHLGTVLYGEKKWPAGLSKEELLQNLAIFGRSGAGKTNVLFHILTQLSVPFVFLDWKRTGRHLLPHLKGKARVYTPGRSLSPFPFNPFIPPPNVEARTYASQVIDSLARAYTLGEGSKSLIETTLHDVYSEERTPTPELLLERLERVKDRERVRGWKITAVRAIKSLAASLDVKSGTGQEEMVRTLLDGQTIIELNGLATSTKRFLLPLLCQWVFHARLTMPQREELNLVLVVEEAHHVLYQHRHQETVMERLLRQCREIGISMIIVDQHPHLISSAALGNTYTSICLNLKDPKDIRKAAQLSQLDQARHLSSLPVGQGVVKLQDRWQEPFLVEFPHVKVEKGSVTDERLAAHLRGVETLSDNTGPEARERDALAGSRPPDKTAERLLLDIQEHPDDGVDKRYKRLGISADKGTRLKRELRTLGLLEEERVSTGRTRKNVLRLTANGQRVLGLEEEEKRESITHEYWKRRYAQEYEEKGYKVQVEATRSAGGNVDVLATRDEERVAVEVETGKSDVIENVRKDLLSGYDRVLVVATDQRAWYTVWRALKRAALVVPQVRVVIAR